jgi:hypothetical protein
VFRFAWPAGLGFLLAELGDPAGARAAYQLAIGSGHAEAAPVATTVLEALAEAGKRQGPST